MTAPPPRLAAQVTMSQCSWPEYEDDEGAKFLKRCVIFVTNLAFFRQNKSPLLRLGVEKSLLFVARSRIVAHGKT